MKISTKGKLSTTTVLAAIMLIAAIYAWANQEVTDADQQRRQISELSRSLSEVRLVTFEYILHRQPRAELQERKVAQRLDQIIARLAPRDAPQTRPAASTRSCPTGCSCCNRTTSRMPFG